MVAVVAKDTKTSEQLSIETIRTLAMDAVQQANAGHPGTAMALAPVAYVLYRDVMRRNPSNPDWHDRDRFVLSAGHACILQYATLHLTGYDLALEELKSFRQWESRTPGHPEHWPHSRHRDDDRAARAGHRERGRHGDGGEVSRAALQPPRSRGRRPPRLRHRLRRRSHGGRLARRRRRSPAHFGLGKLIFFYDDNRITHRRDDRALLRRKTRASASRPTAGMSSTSRDVNDLAATRRRAHERAKAETSARRSIIVRSHIAYPAPHAQDTAKAHGAPLGEDEVQRDQGGLGWDPDAHFVVPDDVHEHMDLRDKGAALERIGRPLGGVAERYPELAEDWDRAFAGELQRGLGRGAARVRPAERKIATRAAGAAR